MKRKRGGGGTRNILGEELVINAKLVRGGEAALAAEVLEAEVVAVASGDKGEAELWT